MRSPLILAYHSVADPVIEPALQVHPATLQSHLKWLREAGYEFVDLADLCGRLFAGKDGANLVALTFDDGYTDFIDSALPCLNAQGIHCVTLFICPEHLGTRSDWNYRSRVVLEHLDLPTLQHLQSRGVRIAAHGLSHRNFCQLEPGQLAEQLDRCQDWFLENLGQASRLLAYPYGDYRDDWLTVVEERFDFAFAVGHGRGFSDRRAISRRTVSEFTTRDRLLSPPSSAHPGEANHNVQRIS